MSDFAPALRELKCDERGRISIGKLISAARGRSFTASVNTEGQILLTPTWRVAPVAPPGLSSGSDAAQARRGRVSGL